MTVVTIQFVAPALLCTFMTTKTITGLLHQFFFFVKARYKYSKPMYKSCELQHLYLLVKLEELPLHYTSYIGVTWHPSSSITHHKTKPFFKEIFSWWYIKKRKLFIKPYLLIDVLVLITTCFLNVTLKKHHRSIKMSNCSSTIGKTALAEHFFAKHIWFWESDNGRQIIHL